MKILPTSAGIKNTSIHNVWVELLGISIAGASVPERGQAASRWALRIRIR